MWRLARLSPRATLDGIEVHQVGTRQSFPFLARSYWHTTLAPRGFDVLVEDINKVPLFTPTWRRPEGRPGWWDWSRICSAARRFRNWPRRWPRPSGWPKSRCRGFIADMRSKRSARVHVTTWCGGHPREHIRVIFPGIDSAHYTPDPSQRADRPLFAYLGRLKK